MHSMGKSDAADRRMEVGRGCHMTMHVMATHVHAGKNFSPTKSVLPHPSIPSSDLTSVCRSVPRPNLPPSSEDVRTDASFSNSRSIPRGDELNDEQMATQQR